MPKTRKTKTQVNLSVDVKIWEKAQELKENFDINWSSLFENMVGDTQKMIEDLEELLIKGERTSTHVARQIIINWIVQKNMKIMEQQIKDIPNEFAEKFLDYIRLKHPYVLEEFEESEKKSQNTQNGSNSH
jgi:hypothetical protein